MAEQTLTRVAVPAAVAPVERPRRGFRWATLLTYTVLTIGAFLSVAPFAWMLSASTMTLPEVSFGNVLTDALLEGDWAGFWQQTTYNYTEAWSVANFSRYMWNSTRITLLTLGGTLLFCIPAAYAFARMHFVGKNVIFTLLLATLIIPEIVTLVPNFLTVVWLGRFSDALCPADGVTVTLFGRAFTFLSNCGWVENWPSLTVPFMASAFSIFLLRQFFAQIPEDYWDAARIDGATHLTYLLRVVVPLSRAPIMTIVTFGFIGSWNALIWPLLVARSEDWRPVAVGLTNFVTADAPGDFHLQMAASVIMVVPILVLYFFTQKQFTEGIAASGVKG